MHSPIAIERPPRTFPPPLALAALVLLSISQFSEPAEAAKSEDLDVENPYSLGASTTLTTLLPQPDSHIIDRLGIMSIQQRNQLARILTRAHDEDDISVYVLLLKNPPPEGLEAYIADIEERWKTRRLLGVVVCLTNRADQLHEHLTAAPGKVPASGTLRERLLAAAQDAQEAGLERKSVPEAVEIAALELLSHFTAILKGGEPQPVQTAAEAASVSDLSAGSDAQATPWSFPVNRALLSASSVLLAIAAAVLFFQRRNRVYRFPECEFRYRLCAPYSGGNNVRLDYRNNFNSPDPKDLKQLRKPS